MLGEEPGSLPKETERQARLPLRLGGLGLRSATRTAFAAYWASWADALPMLKARLPQLVARAFKQNLKSFLKVRLF